VGDVPGDAVVGSDREVRERSQQCCAAHRGPAQGEAGHPVPAEVETFEAADQAAEYDQDAYRAKEV
jgi:hypothetical protein